MSSGDVLMGVVRQLRSHAGDGPTDLELLLRYARQDDQDAFTTLVRRHGGLVLGVARRQLADPHQVEDVFQATFLALARAAGRLGKQASLSNWLFTVALRQARKARAVEARRTAHENTPRSHPAPPPDPLAEITGRELVCLIDEELHRLPDAYRLPLLLCCVEGLSREEAARQLGWSDGAVKGRLERGRRRLAERLAKRGLAPSAVLLAPLSPTTIPPELFARTASQAQAPWSKSLPAGVLELTAAKASARYLLSLVLLSSLLAVGLAGLVVGSGEKGPAPAAPPPPPARVQADDGFPDDPLPAGSIRRLGTSRFRHGTRIEALTVSPDDTLAVATSGSHWLGAVAGYDLKSGKRLFGIGSDFSAGEAVAFSPDGQTLAIREDTTLHLHESRTGKELRKIELPRANPRSITNWLTFSPDGKTLAVTSDGKVISLVDLARGTVIRSLPHQSVVFAAAFSPDGRLLAAGGYDQVGRNYIVRLWEVATGKERSHCNNLRGIRSLAFSPDGNTLAGGGDDGQLRLWEVATGKERRVFPANGRHIRSVAFAPDGKAVAAAGDTICLYDPATGKEQLRIPQKAIGLHFSADSKVLTGAVAGAIHRWDLATGRLLTPPGGDSAVARIATTSGAHLVFIQDEAGQLHVWDGVTGKHLRRLAVDRLQGFGLSPDGRHLAVCVEAPEVRFRDARPQKMIHTGSRVRLYDVQANRFSDRFPSFKGSGEEVRFTGDGKTLLSLDHRDVGIRLWEVATGKQRRMFQGLHEDEKTSFYPISRAALSPDGKTLAVAYRRFDRTSIMYAFVPVRLWDVSTGKELHQLSGHMNQVDDLAFSPDGRLLATCGENRYSAKQGKRGLMDHVFLWEVSSGQRVTGLPEGLPAGANSVAFAPDGRTLASASADGVIRVWERASWTVRSELRGHRDDVRALHFADDGRLLSGGLDTTVLFWRMRAEPSTEGMLEQAWKELALPRAKPAFRAQGRLLGSPAEAVTLLAGRLEPAQAVDSKRIAELIADLDSPQFEKREQASRALGELGRSAESALREAKTKARSAERRRRVEALLTQLAKTVRPAGELRAVRGIEVLEWIASAEAHEVLAKLAKGAGNAERTRSAREALDRLGMVPGDE